MTEVALRPVLHASGGTDFWHLGQVETPRIAPATTWLERVLAGVLVVSLAVPLPWDVTSSGLAVFPFVLPLIGLVVLWALAAADRPARYRSGGRVDAVLVSVFALALATAVSNVVTSSSWRHTSMWVWLGLLYAFARYRAPAVLDSRRLRSLLQGLVLVILVVCIVQFVTGSPWGALAQYLPGGTVQDSQVWNVAEGLKRVQGPFFHTNILGQWLTVVTVVLVAFQLERPTWLGRLAITSSALMFLLTFARGVWLVAPVAILLLLIVGIRAGTARPERAAVISLGAVALAAAVLLLAPGTWTARFESDQGSAVRRATANDAALEVALRVPATGVGYGQFIEEAERFGLRTELRPHNVYLQVLAEQGVVVLVPFIGVVLILLAPRRRRAQLDTSAVSLAAPVLILAWMAYMLVYETANEYAFLPILFFLVGYGHAAADRSQPPEPTSDRHDR